jgi:hypothetical protein
MLTAMQPKSPPAFSALRAMKVAAILLIAGYLISAVLFQVVLGIAAWLYHS